MCAELLMCLVNGEEMLVAEIVDDAPEGRDCCVRWGGELSKAFPINNVDYKWLNEEDAE
jgi:hypothetical protein